MARRHPVIGNADDRVASHSLLKFQIIRSLTAGLVRASFLDVFNQPRMSDRRPISELDHSRECPRQMHQFLGMLRMWVARDAMRATDGRALDLLTLCKETRPRNHAMSTPARRERPKIDARGLPTFA
jgi:hypothetical protein